MTTSSNLEDSTGRAASVVVGELAAAAGAAVGEARDERRDEAPQGVPPSLTGGERVPGEARRERTARGQNPYPSDLVERLVLTTTGRTKKILRRHGVAGDTAFIDWLNFTVADASFDWDGSVDLSEEKRVVDASVVLESIFGFGVTGQLPNGRNFYHRAYALGGAFGFVGMGGQRNTVLISVSGQGLAAARDGWEHRLHAWLKHQAINARITRVDVAHDCYAGEYSVDQAFEEYKAGGAGLAGRMPVCEKRGDWFRPNGSGRTFYIGKRTNGKFARIYEKGKQLGDKDSDWTRVEVEFKSVDRIVPLDILLNAGQYLAGAYPMFEWIHQTQERIATVKKAVEATYQSTVRWLKRQCGEVLRFVEQIEGSPAAVLALVGRGGGEIPAKFKKVAPSLEDAGESIHKVSRPKLPVGLLIDQSVAAW